MLTLSNTAVEGAAQVRVTAVPLPEIDMLFTKSTGGGIEPSALRTAGEDTLVSGELGLSGLVIVNDQDRDETSAQRNRLVLNSSGEAGEKMKLIGSSMVEPGIRAVREVPMLPLSP
jgi:hypothetical protein